MLWTFVPVAFLLSLSPGPGWPSSFAMPRSAARGPPSRPGELDRRRRLAASALGISALSPPPRRRSWASGDRRRADRPRGPPRPRDALGGDQLVDQRGRVERVVADPVGDLLARRPRALGEERPQELARLWPAPPVLADRLAEVAPGAAPRGSTRAGSRPSRNRRPCPRGSRRPGSGSRRRRAGCRRRSARGRSRSRSRPRTRARRRAWPRSGGRGAPRGSARPRRCSASSASERPKWSACQPGSRVIDSIRNE